MNITPQILSIPPYLSTTWKNISSLHAVPEPGGTFKLIVMLASRMRVVVPGLSKASLDAIFTAHALYGSQTSSLPSQESSSQPITFPLPVSGNSLELLNAAVQHNPAQANAPELPKEILDKIAGIAKVLGLDDAAILPKPEPHCNCPYCQISRAFQAGDKTEEKTPHEEVVQDHELQFRNWDIKQSSDAKQLFIVSNPLDQAETYSVFLGEPLGCTCGMKNCEHIRAVLNS